MDHQNFLQSFKKEGKLTIKEGNGNVLTLVSQENWNPSLGDDLIYLLFDLFQIRTICEPFSEVSLDIVEFASKPTIYRSKPNQILQNGPRINGEVRFSLIREHNWNKLLFQISQPILVKLNSGEKPSVSTELFFPLFNSNTKEMFLGAEGEVKILKG